jgi:two-component system, response regulator PdtaR
MSEPLQTMRALRVLIIEDEAMIALLFEDVLSELGHTVCASERTEAGAIAAAARCHPELIISDARLLRGSGISAVTTIMKAGFIPHLFVSGNLIDRKLLNPAAGVLQKPFDLRHLVDAISRAVDPANVRIGHEHANSCRES